MTVAAAGRNTLVRKQGTPAFHANKVPPRSSLATWPRLLAAFWRPSAVPVWASLRLDVNEGRFGGMNTIPSQATPRPRSVLLVSSGT